MLFDRAGFVIGPFWSRAAVDRHLDGLGAGVGTKDNAELRRVFFLQLRIQGSTMGTREELRELVDFMDVSGVRPVVDRTLPLAQARDGFAAVAAGDVFGKVVFTV